MYMIGTCIICGVMYWLPDDTIIRLRTVGHAMGLHDPAKDHVMLSPVPISSGGIMVLNFSSINFMIYMYVEEINHKLDETESKENVTLRAARIT